MKKLLFLLVFIILSTGLVAQDTVKTTEKKISVEWFSVHMGIGVHLIQHTPLPLFQLNLTTLKLKNFYIGPYFQSVDLFSFTGGLHSGARFAVSKNKRHYINTGVKIGGGINKRIFGECVPDKETPVLHTGINFEYKYFFKNGSHNGVGLEGKLAFMEWNEEFGLRDPGIYIYYIVGF